MGEQLHRIGYIRTSPTDRYPNVQVDALKGSGATELHEENGQIDQRHALKKTLDLLGNGDTLIVYRMDRLGRDEHGIVNFQQQLDSMGVTLIVTDGQETAGGSHE